MREEKRRKLDSPDFEPIGNPSLEERASRAKIEGEHVEHVEPSSSKDHIRRDRPVEPEEEESKKLRVSDPTGQKRKDPVSENQSRAKAKAADPVGAKRKPSKEEAQSSAVKSKVADPTGEKRKADSDAEEEAVGQGSPIRSRVEEDEDMLSRITACDVLQLHSVSSLATDSEKLGMETMNLEHWDIDSAVHRDRIT